MPSKMPTLRLSLASLALVISAFGLGGCAVDSTDAAEPEEVATQSQALTVSTPIDIVAPQCRAVLVSVGPAQTDEPANTWGCAADNPYVGQRRISGELESGVDILVDDAIYGAFRCTPSKIVGQPPSCTKGPDYVVEKLCTETRTYQCPCGVEKVDVDGQRAAQCRRLPR
jgi:hypothetical protein